MYKFSLKGGNPVARHGKDIIKIKLDDGKNVLRNEFEDDIDDMIEDINTTKLTRNEYDELKEGLKNEIKPNSKKLHSLYDKLLPEIQKKKGKIINFYDNKLHQIPQDKREVIYICGKSGSGKSTACGEYIYCFNKKFPDADVIVISTVQDDPALEGLDILKADLNCFKDDPITIQDLEDNSLIVFDDIDTIKDKEIKDNVVTLMNQILETGRHRNIYCLITNHLINDYKKTRTIINELTKIILFPCGSSQGNIDYFLDKYLGFTKDQRQEIKKLKSRYIIISNTVPQYVMCSNKIYLL